MLQLPRWLFSSFRFIDGMHIVYSGFILRDNWPLSGDGFMCCGCLFSLRCFYLFELSQWLLLDSLSLDLHKLLCRFFPSFWFIDGMHVMHSGFILRDNWPLSGDGFMCCGCLFSLRCFCLFKLSAGHIPYCSWCDFCC